MAFKKLGKRLLLWPFGFLFLLMTILYFTPQTARLFYPKEVLNISPSEAKNLIQSQKLLILDVREQAEYEVSHLSGAKRFTPEVLKSIEPDTEILVYCTVGVRSASLAKELKNQGFSNVHNIDLGIVNWKNQGFEVVDDKEQTTEKVHVYKGIFGHWLKKGEAVK
ncbi:rhodanese-like domain-containing protein [Roseivirga seohaensis]|uniref:rhodanese-like domain-containing protein n=1 Tax=Roseivirga seohaensis TaxID=1914963 RepID=UPI0009E74F1B|nr:rhodanese-like domain-containing protein [Roseivirga seohaensis]